MPLCAQQWRDTDRLVRADQAQTERFLTLTYEDLTARPQQVLRQVTDFLDLEPLPPEPCADTFTVHGVVSPIRNLNPTSFGRLTPADLDAIEAVAAEELTLYGYKRPSP